jgi:ABC-type oligopeptide transport system substrate-binding subunit
MRCVVGVINRDAEGLPLGRKLARQALNLAVDRERIVREAMFGRARPLAGLVPPSAVTRLHRLSPYAYDPKLAAAFWQDAAGPLRGTEAAPRPLRLVVLDGLERVARVVAEDLRGALGIEVEVRVYEDEEKRGVLRRLAEKRSTHEWDVLLHSWSDARSSGQTTDAPPLELHRGFVGESGEFRAGPVVPRFEQLYEKLANQIRKPLLARASYRIDKLVYEEALALFLCAPQALYAVNKHVDFTPYRTTFELAECRVGPGHWSRR